MSPSPHQDRLRNAARRRSSETVSTKVSVERMRAEIRADARRRADIVESGTPEERKALYAEYEEERQARILRHQISQVDAELDRLEREAEDNFYLALNLQTGRNWTPGEAPPQVVYLRRELWVLHQSDPERWG